MKPLLTPIPVLFAGVLCKSQTISPIPFSHHPSLMVNAFIRDPEGMRDTVSLNEADRRGNTQDRNYVSCTKFPLEINY
jgi:hypothetical protein